VHRWAAAFCTCLVACANVVPRSNGDGSPEALDGGAIDGGSDAGMDASSETDAGPTPDCAVSGVPGYCIDTAACAEMTGYQSTPGYCPGPIEIQCCTPIPNVADNPPIPDGYRLMHQSEVTPEMTDWAVAILRDPTTYPMFSTALRVFGTLTVLARVEWHPPDFQNNTVHRGVTLYTPI
jgi:hypothetical protein